MSREPISLPASRTGTGNQGIRIAIAAVSATLLAGVAAGALASAHVGPFANASIHPASAAVHRSSEHLPSDLLTTQSPSPGIEEVHVRHPSQATAPAGPPTQEASHPATPSEPDASLSTAPASMLNPHPTDDPEDHGTAPSSEPSQSPETGN